MHRAPRLRTLLPTAFAAAVLLPHIAAAQVQTATPSLAVATANEQRQPAGRMVDGVLRVELEAVEATWRPRGPDGPAVHTPAFAEAGAAPSVPGPLIRMAVGTPVEVRIRNRLGRPIVVRGLADRVASGEVGGAAGLPGFLRGDSLVIAPGAVAEHRFTVTRPVTSFYFGRVVPVDGAPGAPSFIPGGDAGEGAFMGALLADPAGAAPAPGERLFVITRWDAPEEADTSSASWKVMINGRSWPYTERLDYAVGDTVRWRVLNLSLVDHPMHLHGFYFSIDGIGDTERDTVYPRLARRTAVTEVMQELSSLRLTWVAERPGNWLFHCHLIRHMGEAQVFPSERSRAATHAPATPAPGSEPPGHDGMAGMILGISVRDTAGVAAGDPEPARTIHLWTGTRPGVYDGAPEHGFVLQEGATPPAADSTVVPGSPLVLRRGEPTAIIVHNRLSFPLSVHWHGLELASRYDGVGYWSGTPGSTLDPIPPGESRRVIISPLRSGTFFYHTHGEPGHELAQGLYGGFLVLEPGASWDRGHDRLFMLAARGAAYDAPPAINGRSQPESERFTPGQTYRLRFAHISPDEYRTVRLLRDGRPVAWTPVAKDGAELPAAQAIAGPAMMELGVGEARDFEWTPAEAALYLLEVASEFYPAVGGTIVQRVPFIVGEIADSVVAATLADLEVRSLTPAERRTYHGRYTGVLIPVGGPKDWELATWEEGGQLMFDLRPRGQPPLGEPEALIPVGEHTFSPGRVIDGTPSVTRSEVEIRFLAGADGLDSVAVSQGGAMIFGLARSAPPELTDEQRTAVAGTYAAEGMPLQIRVTAGPEGLRLVLPNGVASPLVPLLPSVFQVEGGGAPPGTVIRFVPESARAASATLHALGGPAIRLSRVEE